MISLKEMGERHKVWISYHHADQSEVNTFVETFDNTHDIFISRILGFEDDIIDSRDTDYVMRVIRQRYFADSTVTIVLIGKCTWARRYVDWEIQASLRSTQLVTPNGLVGITLPSYSGNGYPDRLNKNLKQDANQEDCYARVMSYPTSTQMLKNAIEDAYQARTLRSHLIVNPRDRFTNNRDCK